MTLISLLVILFLEYQFKLSQVLAKRFGSQKLLPAWYKAVISGPAKSPVELAYAIVIVLPVALVIWLTETDGSALVSLLQFFIVLLVLAYSLGPMNQNQHLAEYFRAVERGDLEAAYLDVQENLNQKVNLQQPENFEDLGKQVTEMILRQCNFRLFGVLFYFVIFGIGGALAYNLVCNLEYHVRDDEDAKIGPLARKVRSVIDWLPQRLTALLYGLAGDFNGAFGQFLPYAFKSPRDSKGILENTGLGAMGIDPDSRQNDVIDENKQAMALVSRSAMVFVLIIAIMTVFGWLN
jgi:membrane protein required for beta-lactamase induction